MARGVMVSYKRPLIQHKHLTSYRSLVDSSQMTLFKPHLGFFEAIYGVNPTLKVDFEYILIQGFYIR